MATTERSVRRAIDDPDTNNATYIGWTELSSDDHWKADFWPINKREYYQYLDRMNGGYQNGPIYQNHRYETYRLNRWLILSLSSHLEMPDGLRLRAAHLFHGLDRSKLGYAIETVALVTCAYVIHQFDPHRECHPQTSNEEFDLLVERELQRLNLSKEQYASIFGKIEHRVRTGQNSPPKHDAYQIDPDGLHPWREVDADRGDGWL